MFAGDEIVTKGATLVLEAEGGWLWGKDRTTEMSVSLAEASAPLCVHGSAAALEEDVVRAIRTSLSGTAYFHVMSAQTRGTLEGLDVDVTESSMSRAVCAGGKPVATRCTKGSFSATFKEPSKSNWEVDVVPVKKGKWWVKNSGQKCLVDGNLYDGISRGGKQTRSGQMSGRVKGDKTLADDESVAIPAGTTDDPEESAHSFTLWVSAFMPRDVADKIEIPGQKAIPKPDRKTMVRLPWYSSLLLGYFDTDQREFSCDWKASSRVKATVCATNRLGSHAFKKHCGPTTRRNLKGTVTKEDTAADKDIRISSKEIGDRDNGADPAYEHRMFASSGNPLIPFAPHIDFDITVTERWVRNSKSVVFTADGVVDDYPAYEGYVTFDGETKTLFTERAVGTALGLYGPPKRKVSGEVTFRLK